MQFEILLVVEISVLVFAVVISCALADRYEYFFNRKEGDVLDLRHVGIYLQTDTALQPGRPTSASLEASFF
jgi:hypothetical protein